MFNFKKAVALALAAISVFSLASCVRKGKETEEGFIDNKSGIEYVYCKSLGVYASGPATDEWGKKILDPYLYVDNMPYYAVDFEEPNKFLTYEDSGEYLLLRAKDIEEPCIANFDSIAGVVFNGTNTVPITQIYADAEYRTEETQEEYAPEQTYICRLITDALVNGESQTLPEGDEFVEENRFFIRMLSKKYPGLYYVVVFLTDTSGRHYLRDRAADKTVLCPYEVEVFMVNVEGTDV